MNHRLNVAAVVFTVVLLCASGAPVPASATRDFASAVKEWGDSLTLDESVAEQIAKYSREKDDLGETYPAALAAEVRRLTFAAAARALASLPKAAGEPVVEVEYLEPGFADAAGAKPDDGHQRDFEEGFIRIESLAFIPVEGVEPQIALELFSSPQFRKDVSSRIARIWPENDLSCIEVDGVTAIMPPTLACNRVDELIETGLASQHSQVVANPGGDDYQTVYFKESLKTFVAVDGGLVYHYINFTRTVKLGRIKRSFGRGKIEESEKEKIRELQHRLSDGN